MNFSAFLRIGIVLLLFSSSGVVCSQTSVLRREIEANLRSDQFYVIPAQGFGVLVISGEAKVRARDQDWQATLYDTEFREKWSRDIVIYGTLALNSWKQMGHHLYIHFASNTSGKYAVLDVNFADESITQSNGDIRQKGIWKPIMVYEQQVIAPFQGKRLITLTRTDMTNGSSSSIAVLPKGKFQLLSANLPEDADEICMVYNQIAHGDASTHLAWLTPEGKTKREVLVEYKGTERINSGSATKIDENTTIVTGTYNNKSNALYNQGLYFGMMQDQKLKYVKYYSFTGFEHFFDYMNERAQDKIEKKIRRKKAKGTDLKVNYRLLTHPVRKLGENYLTLSEAYYPQYRTVYRTVYVNGVPTTQSYQVFDGWRYTHAVLACFDPEGNLLWDHCFPIWNILTFNLKRYVRLGILDDESVEVVLAYGSAIKTMTIKDGEVKKDVSVDYIQTLNEDDRIKWTSSAGIEFWYDNYWIAWGYQKIKNEDPRAADRRRWVFYFNKVEY